MAEDKTSDFQEEEVEPDLLQHMEIDSIWRKLGKYGKYQVKQTVFILMCFPALTSTPLSIIFLGYIPDFVCNRPGNETDYWSYTEHENTNITYSKCTITNVHSDPIYVNETTCVYGYNYSIPKERSIVSEWDLVCENEMLSGFTQTLLIFGQGFGSVASSVGDKFGRKTSYIIAQFMYFGVLCGTAFVQNYWSFAVLRFFTGFLQTTVDLVLWAAILETIPGEHRPYVGSIGGAWWGLSTALMAPVAYLLREYSWRTVQLALSVASVHVIFAVFLMEESLRWLIVTGRTKEAFNLLKRACAMNKVSMAHILDSKNDTSDSHDGVKRQINFDKHKASEETQYFNSTVQSDTDQNLLNKVPNSVDNVDETGSTSSDTVFTMLKDKEILKNSLIIWLSWFVNVLVYYGLYMTSAVISNDRYMQFFLSAIAELPGTICVWYLMNRHGRRFTCMLGHGMSGIALLLATVLSHIEDVSNSVPALITILAIIGKFGVSMSFTGVYTYTPEIFPTSLRTSGLGIASCFGRIAGGLTPYSDNLAQIASWLPGAIFAGSSLLITWLLRFVPETKGKELPQTIADVKQLNRNRTNKGMSFEVEP